MAINTILDPILSPLLPLGAFWTIFIICLAMSLITTIIYKYTTNQEKLKEIKADMKRLQKKATAYSKEGNSDKAMALQKDIMKMNMEFMKSSFRSTLFTFIPILLFFGWLGVNLAFAPILPMADFNVTMLANEDISINSTFTLVLPPELNATSVLTKNLSENKDVIWTGISGPQGEYELTLIHEESKEEYSIPVIITASQEYAGPIHINQISDTFKEVHVGHEKLIILEGIPFFQHFPVIKNWGWFGIYFLFAIGFSIALKKLLKIV
jgi:uncharacterized membrane protein (DUF106 family)